MPPKFNTEVTEVDPTKQVPIKYKRMPVLRMDIKEKDVFRGAPHDLEASSSSRIRKALRRGDERIELPCELSAFEQEEIKKFKDYIERMKNEDVEGIPAPKLINTIKVEDVEGSPASKEINTIKVEDVEGSTDWDPYL